MNIEIRQAGTADADAIALMVGELLDEIMTAIGEQAFQFGLDAAVEQLRTALAGDRVFAFLASTPGGKPAGFTLIYEGFALYAQGHFGTLSEFYVRPPYRSQGVGHRLVEAARALGRARNWRRLEVTTPPLPMFARTLAFYESEGFAITGGRKLKTLL